MITPLEIETKEFSKSVRGYDRDEVDEFLDEIILDLQSLLANMDELKEENQKLKDENEEHKKSQKKVMDTLDSAKRLMKDISDSAEKRADIIIRNAKMDAETILNDARNNAGASNSQGKELYDTISSFRNRYKELLQRELDSLESGSGALLASLENEFQPASLSQNQDIPEVLDREFGNQFHIEEIDISNDDTDVRLAELEEEVEGFANTSAPRPQDTRIIDAEEISRLLEEAAEDKQK